MKIGNFYGEIKMFMFFSKKSGNQDLKMPINQDYKSISIDIKCDLLAFGQKKPS